MSEAVEANPPPPPPAAAIEPARPTRGGDEAPAPEAAPAAPVIQVTIGRVEVRAVMAPPSPPRPAPRPRLSLDDYLRQSRGDRP